MAESKDQVFTSGEVARICGVSPDTVSRWFDLGQLEGYRLGPGGDRRIPYASLRQFMLNHGIPIERLEEDQKRILVVDDDPYYLDTIPTALGKTGEYQVFTASTGFDAGAMVAEHNPQLIILDIHLSDMDGRLVSQRVRNRPDTKNTRILAISGYLDREQLEELEQYGFDDFLQKPFSLEDLGTRVEQLLAHGGRPRARRG
jgi:excisionase family DNA binding protein